VEELKSGTFGRDGFTRENWIVRRDILRARQGGGGGEAPVPIRGVSFNECEIQEGQYMDKTKNLGPSPLTNNPGGLFWEKKGLKNEFLT